MVIDEILFAERFDRDRYRQEAPRKLVLSGDYYEKLCEELGVEDIDTFHGMELEVTDDVETFFIGEEEIYTDDYEEFES